MNNNNNNNNNNKNNNKNNGDGELHIFQIWQREKNEHTVAFPIEGRRFG